MAEQSTELTVHNHHHGKAQAMIAVVFEGKFVVMEPSVCFRSLGLQSGFPLMELMEDDQKIFRSEAARQHIMNVASSRILIKVSPAASVHKAFALNWRQRETELCSDMEKGLLARDDVCLVHGCCGGKVTAHTRQKPETEKASGFPHKRHTET